MNSYNYSTLSDFKNRMSEKDYEFCEQLITNCKKFQLDKGAFLIKLLGEREIGQNLCDFLVGSVGSQYPKDHEIKFYFHAEIQKYKHDKMIHRIITLFDETQEKGECMMVN